MSAVSMRKYITLLESTHETAPTAVHISVASPSDVFQHMQTKEAISPNQITVPKMVKLARPAASMIAAVAKVTKIIDYLITTPAAIEKGLVKNREIPSNPNIGRTYDVTEFTIPWRIEFVEGEGFYITIAGQKSSFIPGAYDTAFSMIKKVYLDAGWTPIPNGPKPAMPGIELRTNQVILRAFDPTQVHPLMK